MKTIYDDTLETVEMKEFKSKSYFGKILLWIFSFLYRKSWKKK